LFSISLIFRAATSGEICRKLITWGRRFWNGIVWRVEKNLLGKFMEIN
jgi:hypothetical protein